MAMSIDLKNVVLKSAPAKGATKVSYRVNLFCDDEEKIIEAAIAHIKVKIQAKLHLKDNPLILFTDEEREKRGLPVPTFDIDGNTHFTLEQKLAMMTPEESHAFSVKQMAEAIATARARKDAITTAILEKALADLVAQKPQPIVTIVKHDENASVDSDMTPEEIALLKEMEEDEEKKELAKMAENAVPSRKNNPKSERRAGRNK